MKQIESKINWYSSLLSEACIIDKVVITLSDEELELINKALWFCKENKDVIYVPIRLSGANLFDEEKQPVNWEPLEHELLVYSTGNVYYRSQNKHDDSDIIESNEIKL